ncbi:MAG: PHP domain-containing protein [Candidatus Micrarchaeota archaeon]
MKIDMHTHSKYSSDGVSSVESMFIVAKKKGVSGIALTDHSTAVGWKDAQAAAKKHKMFFVKGEEIKAFDESRNRLGDVLCFFLQKQVNARSLFEIVDEVKEQDALLFMAHPFDYTKPCFGEKAGKFSRHFDGVEVFNSKTVRPDFNEKALVFARKYKFLQSAGSDAHIKYEVGNAYVEADAFDLEEFRKALIKRKIKVRGKISPRYLSAISCLQKAFSKAGRR